MLGVSKHAATEKRHLMMMMMMMIMMPLYNRVSHTLISFGITR